MRAFVGRLALGVTCVAALAVMRTAAAAGPAPITAIDADTIVPAWLYPSSPPAVGPAKPFDSVTALHLQRSSRTFVETQLHDLFFAPDWDPASHPAMPEVVARGRRPAVYACAYCHMPDGAGRPENAPLAGLPAGYIVQQVADFRSHARSIAYTGGAWVPYDNMRRVAESATEAEVAEAARYFSQLRPRQRTRIVEADAIPRLKPVTGLYALVGGSGTEGLAGRLMEVPVDLERHEWRDPNIGYVAYVPRGSIARGRAIMMRPMNEAKQACGSCHGPALRGMGIIPPIAGRSPGYLVRQLLAFRTGTRSTPTSAPMQGVSQRLSLDEMIAVAAYAATLRP